MADSPEGPSDAPKPRPASIPDLKKAQESKPAAFAWSPGAPIARAAASASAAAPRRPPTALERLTSTQGKLAVLAVMMLLGGAALSVTVLPDGTLGGGGAALGGIKSTIKFNAGRGRDSTGFTKGGEAPAKGQMNFGLIKGGAKVAGGDGTPGDPGGVPGGAGEEPMAYDEGATSRAAGGAAGGGTAAPGADGGAEGAGGLSGGGAAPKLSSPYGKINFQNMRRVSGTAGFRGIKGRSETLNKKIQTRGSAASSSGASGGGAGSGAGGAVGSALTPFSRNGTRSVGDGGKGGGGGTADGGGGGGGGGGANVKTDDLEKIEAKLPSIPDLLSQANSLREEADKEEKKAVILAAAGQLPQAHYHYDKAEKKKKKANELTAEADRQTQAMTDLSGGLIEE